MTIVEAIKKQLGELLDKEGIDIAPDGIALTTPSIKEHGDYASSIALRLAKKLNTDPLTLAQKIAAAFKVEGVVKVEAVKPGFINFFLSKEQMTDVINQINVSGSAFGSPNESKNIKVNLEYVSANPTGSLHLGHARGAAIGDSLARIMKKAGYSVTREYYVNDAGKQIDHMAESLRARYLQAAGDEKAQVPADGYHGQDIVNIAAKLYGEAGDKYKNDTEESLDFFREYGTKQLLSKIKEDLKNFGVEFDVFTSEKAIRESGKIEQVLTKLKPQTFAQDNAIFLKTIDAGDDKDRVIVKSDGSYTYFLPDIAYHWDKFARGFDRLIDVFGADHAGYVARLKIAMKDLGLNPDNLTVSMVQIVRLFKGGTEYKMSKRTGDAIAMNELIAEVGVDAVRYFFSARATNSHLDFDLDLAQTLSTANPVYYAQYTHARLCSLLENGATYYDKTFVPAHLSDDKENALLKILKEYPERVQEAANTLEPYKMTLYIQNLAVVANDWYQHCRVINEANIPLSKSRLALAGAIKTVLADALSLIDVSAPAHM